MILELKQMTKSIIPDAQLLMAPDCSHCPVVLDGLSILIKKGKLRRIDIVNLPEHPEIAQALGVRSVPWTRIGPFELEGVQTPAELEKWADKAAKGEGDAEYFEHLLESQQLAKATGFIERSPDSISALVSLIGSLETPMGIRIGAGAILEELSNKGKMTLAIDPLIELTDAADAQIRADACHYLSLSGESSVIPIIQSLLQDDDPEVRTIARESLEDLNL